MRFSLLFVDIDIRNKNNLDGVHMICCGLHMYNIAITILIEMHHTRYSSSLLWLYSDSTNITLAC